VRSVDSLALAILRLVGEEARKERTTKVIAELPVDVATFLLNEKREWIQSIEDRTGVQLLLIANPRLETPNYSIRRVRDDQTLLPEFTGASYDLATKDDGLLEDALKMSGKKSSEEPAVTGVVPATPAPAPTPAAPARNTATTKAASSGGLLGFLKRLFVGSDNAESTPQPEQRSNRNRGHSRNERGQRNQRRSRSSGRQGERNRRSGGRQNSARNQDSNRGQNRPQKSKQSADARSAEKTMENNEKTNQAQRADDSAKPPRRRRRRRKSGGRNPEQQAEQKTSNETAQAEGNAEQQKPPARADVDGNRAENGGDNRPAASRPQRSEAAEAKQAPSGGSEHAAAESKGSKDSGKDVGKDVGKDTGKDSVQNQADKERLLPWETSVPKTQDKTYKVWSSEDKAE
jgi:ribonuclease E